MAIPLPAADRTALEPHLAAIAADLNVENVLYYYGEASAYLVPEDVQNFKDATKQMAPRSKLAFILHTFGGDLKAAVDIIEEMRGKFEHVTAIIPAYAYSSGTVIALSCDRIIISESGFLSPTDPQANIPDLKSDLPLRDVVRAHNEYKAGANGGIAQELIEGIHQKAKFIYDTGAKRQKEAMLSVPGRSSQEVDALFDFFCEKCSKPHGEDLSHDDICHLPLKLDLLEGPKLPPVLGESVKQADDILKDTARKSKGKFSVFVPYTAAQP